MDAIEDVLQENEPVPEPAPSVSSPAERPLPRQSLPAKGSCWYCEEPVDNVRRFCGKECSEAFDEEAAFTAEAINSPPGDPTTWPT